jgi:hypothetical protein
MNVGAGRNVMAAAVATTFVITPGREEAAETERLLRLFLDRR